MPYKNIVFIKLLWKELLFEDTRFIEHLDDSQKGLYLMLLILAGATANNIKNDENYIKRTLNLSENVQKIRQNLDKICDAYPKLISRNGFLKFKNFNKIHNYLRNADGTPKESLGIDKNRIDKNRIDKIRIEYIRLKGWSLKDFSSDDYSRTAKAIKTLINKAVGKDEQALRALDWASRQTWCDWSLETIIKQWQNFLKWDALPALMKEKK